MRIIKDLWVIFLPVLTTGLVLQINKYYVIVISVIAAYVCILLCDATSKYESLYLFVLTILITIPINHEQSMNMCRYFFREYMDAHNSFIMMMFCYPLAYFLLLSVEETLLGAVGVAIWPLKKDIIESKFHGSGGK